MSMSMSMWMVVDVDVDVALVTYPVAVARGPLPSSSEVVPRALGARDDDLEGLVSMSPAKERSPVPFPLTRGNNRPVRAAGLQDTKAPVR